MNTCGRRARVFYNSACCGVFNVQGPFHSPRRMLRMQESRAGEVAAPALQAGESEDLALDVYFSEVFGY